MLPLQTISYPPLHQLPKSMVDCDPYRALCCRISTRSRISHQTTSISTTTTTPSNNSSTTSNRRSTVAQLSPTSARTATTCSSPTTSSHYQLPFIQPNMYAGPVPLSADSFMYDNVPVKLEDPHFIFPPNLYTISPYFNHPPGAVPVALSYLSPPVGYACPTHIRYGLKGDQYLPDAASNATPLSPTHGVAPPSNPMGSLYDRTASAL
ncbi:hypothetical protein HGRIS_012237 [Hohenbuehelia grisea]|uniref:Uncharacterized protein n=1 Tax=Hohenbuehelia grisea TaxID=104357 RepID=A0ABR3IRR3_9AGAR